MSHTPKDRAEDLTDRLEEAIKIAVEVEREECARLCEICGGHNFAALIRGRNVPAPEWNPGHL